MQVVHAFGTPNVSPGKDPPLSIFLAIPPVSAKRLEELRHHLEGRGFDGIVYVPQSQYGCVRPGTSQLAEFVTWTQRCLSQAGVIVWSMNKDDAWLSFILGAFLTSGKIWVTCKMELYTPVMRLILRSAMAHEVPIHETLLEAIDAALCKIRVIE